MHIRIFTTTLAFTFLMSLSAWRCQPASAEGLFQRTTGIRTPEPIRKIAPNGLKVFKGEQSTSSLMVVSPPRIDSSGRVWSGTGNTGQSAQVVGTASIKRNTKGEAYWTSNYRDIYGTAQPVRAPQYDRAASKPELLGREASGNIELSNRVTTRKMPTPPSQGSQNFPNQNGLTQKQQEQALIFNSIGQLVQGISQAAEQNRRQNLQQGNLGQPTGGGQQQWGQPQYRQPEYRTYPAQQYQSQPQPRYYRP
jgi:hypothetical protein